MRAIEEGADRQRMGRGQGRWEGRTGGTQRRRTGASCCVSDGQAPAAGSVTTDRRRLPGRLQSAPASRACSTRQPLLAACCPPVRRSASTTATSPQSASPPPSPSASPPPGPDPLLGRESSRPMSPRPRPGPLASLRGWRPPATPGQRAVGVVERGRRGARPARGRMWWAGAMGCGA